MMQFFRGRNPIEMCEFTFCIKAHDKKMEFLSFAVECRQSLGRQKYQKIIIFILHPRELKNIHL